MRRLCMFYKIKTFKIPEYLYYLTPNDHRTYNTQNLDFVGTYFCRTDAFKYSFFPYSISEWNKLDLELRNAKYRSHRPSINHVHKIHDPLGLKLLTRLGLSHLT